ncbi:MAG: putative PurR-regulated permease PerM [Verrucomicrobiales bacterium]|jgi:predicted PurR-regulated permease PerM
MAVKKSAAKKKTNSKGAARRKTKAAPKKEAAPEPAEEQKKKLDFTRECSDGIVIPSDFQLTTVWRAITGTAIAVIAVLIVMLIMATGKVLGFLQPVLVPVAIAGILAYLIDPIVIWLRGRKILGKEITRIWAIVIVFTVATMGMILLAISIIVPAAEQIPNLVNSLGKAYQNTYAWGIEQFHTIQTEGNPDTSPVKKATDPEVLGKAASWALSSLKGFVGAIGSFFGFLGYSVGFIMVPIYLFFFLKDSHSIRDQWGDYVPLRASPFKDEVVDVLKEINGYLIAFFRGQMLVSIIDGALVGIALLFVPVMRDYAIIFAVFLAILGVIPFVGFILTIVPAVAIAVVNTMSWDHPWQIPITVALIFIIIQQFDGIVIQPRIVGESVGLHPLTVIFSVFFWSLIIGGVLGALLAVPLTAAVKVLFRRYIWQKNLNAEEPAPA